MDLNFPAKCTPRVCELFTTAAADNGCKEVMCHLAPFIKTEMCGQKLVRDIYRVCGWFQRGASIWIGANAAQEASNTMTKSAV